MYLVCKEDVNGLWVSKFKNISKIFTTEMLCEFYASPMPKFVNNFYLLVFLRVKRKIIKKKPIDSLWLVWVFLIVCWKENLSLKLFHYIAKYNTIKIRFQKCIYILVTRGLCEYSEIWGAIGYHTSVVYGKEWTNLIGIFDDFLSIYR